jgi:hypothetical protein
LSELADIILFENDALTAPGRAVMMLSMRTTVTLDQDVAELLRETAHRMRHSFKEALNGAVRRGLEGMAKPKQAVFHVHPVSMGIRAGVDPARLADVGDDAEIDAFLDLTRRLTASKRKSK